MTEIRRLAAADEASLWTMLFYASHSDHEPGSSVASLKEVPSLARYVADWGRPTDFGYLASGPEREAIGAAWARLFTGDTRGYGWVDDETPELAIAIAPGGRGRGLGSALLEQLVGAAKDRFAGLSLSVRSDNPALRLYERFGFRPVAEVPNRVSGISLTMVLRFDRAQAARQS